MASESKTAIIMIGLLATVGARACKAAAKHGDDVARVMKHADDVPTPRARPKAPELPEPTSSRAVEPASSEAPDAFEQTLDVVDAGRDVVAELSEDEHESVSEVE